jgi:glycosyltransferase involved in cell wall biosynthesis
MKVSIITPSLNSVDTIEDTLLSVENQSHADIEHIVVDGDSTDGTVDIIKKHESRLAKWVSEKDQGIYDAMNKGISMASGDIIGILNSNDVYADQEAIEQVVRCFYANPELDSVYGDLFYVAKKDINRVIRHWKTGIQKPFNSGWHPPHPAFFIKKGVLKEYGSFDLSFKLSADFELMLRLFEKHKISSFYLQKTLVKMRRGGITNNKFSNIVKQNIECLKAFRKNNISVSVFYPVIRLISKLGQYFHD